MKPRVKFCWECGNKLLGNSHVLKRVDGEVRTLHLSCGERSYPNLDPMVYCMCCGYSHEIGSKCPDDSEKRR